MSKQRKAGKKPILDEKEVRKELRKLGDEFLNAIRNEVDSCVVRCDAERLHGLIHQVDIYLGYRVIHDLRQKGLEQDIRKLCDKAGRIRREVEA